MNPKYIKDLDEEEIDQGYFIIFIILVCILGYLYGFLFVLALISDYI